MTHLPDLLERLARRGQTVAVAESLTGGLVVAALTGVPGASRVVRGGVVVYATDLKREVLGVDADLLATGGAVQPEVAEQMARGVRSVLGADFGVATTGVAGPDPQDGRPVGEVHVAVVGPDRTSHRSLQLGTLGRVEIRAIAVEAALGLLADQSA